VLVLKIVVVVASTSSSEYDYNIIETTISQTDMLTLRLMLFFFLFGIFWRLGNVADAVCLESTTVIGANGTESLAFFDLNPSARSTRSFNLTELLLSREYSGLEQAIGMESLQLLADEVSADDNGSLLAAYCASQINDVEDGSVTPTAFVICNGGNYPDSCLGGVLLDGRACDGAFVCGTDDPDLGSTFIEVLNVTGTQNII